MLAHERADLVAVHVTVIALGHGPNLARHRAYYAAPGSAIPMQVAIDPSNVAPVRFFQWVTGRPFSLAGVSQAGWFSTDMADRGQKEGVNKKGTNTQGCPVTTFCDLNG